MARLGHWKTFALAPPPGKVQIANHRRSTVSNSVSGAAAVNLSPPAFSRTDSGTSLCPPPHFRVSSQARPRILLPSSSSVGAQDGAIQTSSSGVTLMSKSKSTQALPRSAADRGEEQHPEGRRSIAPPFSRWTVLLKDLAP